MKVKDQGISLETENIVLQKNKTRRHISKLCLTPHALLLASTLIYFFPFIVGSFEYILPSGRRVLTNYSSETGYAAATIIALLIFSILVIRYKRLEFRIKQDYKSEQHTLILALASLLIFVILDGNIFLTNKSEMLEGTDRVHLAFYQICTISFIFSALTGFSKNKLLLFLSVFGLLLIMYAGHRSSFAIAIIGVMYIHYRNKPITRNLVFFTLLALTLFSFLIVYKTIYVAVKNGYWDLVIQGLSLENLISQSLGGMEQFIIFSHLDFVVTSDFRLECSNAWMIPLSIIPFTDEILASHYNFNTCDYNEQIQPYFFSGYQGGVAANIWAEFFGYFGYAGFPVLIIILSAFFILLEKIIKITRNPILISGIIVALINMAFYIQRKELFGGFISAKRAVTVSLILILFAWLIKRVRLQNKKHRVIKGYQ